MPEALGKAYLYALPCVELLVGILILLGWFTRLARAGTRLSPLRERFPVSLAADAAREAAELEAAATAAARAP